MDRGLTAFGNNKKLTMSISLAFTALSLILFIVAMAGWTTDPTNLQSAGWAFSTSNNGKTYIGLQGFSTDYFSSVTYYSFADCTGNASFCTGCQNGGRAALGLTLLAFFLTMGLFILTLLRMFKDTSGTKLTSVGFIFFIWLFSVAGWGAWNTQCFGALANATYTIAGVSVSLSFSHMGGFGAAVAGWFFIWMIGIVHLLTPVEDFSAGGSFGSGSGGDNGQTGDFQKMEGASNA